MGSFVRLMIALKNKQLNPQSAACEPHIQSLYLNGSHSKTSQNFSTRAGYSTKRSGKKVAQ